MLHCHCALLTVHTTCEAPENRGHRCVDRRLEKALFCVSAASLIVGGERNKKYKITRSPKTIKIGMYKSSKRSDRGGGGGDRSSSPITKRSRSTLGRYGDPESDEEPDRGRGRSPVGSRGGRDYYESSSRGGGGGGYKESS